MPHLKLELSLAPARICGVDEAGRGPWAGPVVAAAVIIHSRARMPRGIDDSKKLTRIEREQLFTRILNADISHGIGIACHEEISQHNIWGATQLAMCRAVAALAHTPDIALIDGHLHPKGMECETRPVIGGDGISLSIAAASILAKVTRDRMMADYAAQYPHYGFEKHAGYGTKQHQAALAEHGPCPIHRSHYTPIRILRDKKIA